MPYVIARNYLSIHSMRKHTFNIDHLYLLLRVYLRQRLATLSNCLKAVDTVQDLQGDQSSDGTCFFRQAAGLCPSMISFLKRILCAFFANSVWAFGKASKRLPKEKGEEVRNKKTRYPVLACFESHDYQGYVRFLSARLCMVILLRVSSGVCDIFHGLYIHSSGREGEGHRMSSLLWNISRVLRVSFNTTLQRLCQTGSPTELCTNRYRHRSQVRTKNCRSNVLVSLEWQEDLPEVAPPNPFGPFRKWLRGGCAFLQTATHGKTNSFSADVWPSLYGSEEWGVHMSWLWMGHGSDWAEQIDSRRSRLGCRGVLLY